MTTPGAMADAVTAVSAAGLCRHPIRLWGRAVDAATGELTERAVLVACKDRRQIVCPACADRYQADAFQLVAAGLRGGKGVPASVAAHPACFVTLTAPSFGPVHSRPRDQHAHAPCRVRRRDVRCPHRVALACAVHHGPADPLLGQALCPECFDYEGAILWNARVSLLWQRTSVALGRAVAQGGGVSRRAQRGTFRLSYIKVVEFQRRGLVHLHAVVRADGPEGPLMPPPHWLDATLLAGAIEDAAARTAVAGLSRPGESPASVRWGTERDVREIEGVDRTAVASYLAKYAVKAATEDPVLARRLEHAPSSASTRAAPHAAALVQTAWRLGGVRELGRLRLRAHAHTFGYGGHFATKSRHWSTTFDALRATRQSHAQAGGEGPTFVEDAWRYAGRGYESAAATRLADVLADAIATRPRPVPATSPPSALGHPHGR